MSSFHELLHDKLTRHLASVRGCVVYSNLIIGDTGDYYVLSIQHGKARMQVYLYSDGDAEFTVGSTNRRFEECDYGGSIDELQSSFVLEVTEALGQVESG